LRDQLLASVYRPVARLRPADRFVELARRIPPRKRTTPIYLN